jgi:WD40 repeat protein
LTRVCADLAVQGAVQALAAAGDMLFSAGQDASLRVWKLDPASNQWGCVAVLKAEQGGHRAPISCMWASHPLLFSADYLGTLKVGGGRGRAGAWAAGCWPALQAWRFVPITAGQALLSAKLGCPWPRATAPAPRFSAWLQVWDLNAGVVRQTVDKAHSGSDVPCITNLTVWEGHIISASLDGLIKIWEPADPASGNIINPTPIFSFPEQVGMRAGSASSFAAGAHAAVSFGRQAAG